MNSSIHFKSAYIFGYCEAGFLLKELLINNGIQFLGFIDNYHKETLKLNDIPPLGNDVFILVSSYSSIYEIGKQLEDKGISNYLFLHEIAKIPEFDFFPHLKEMVLIFKNNKDRFLRIQEKYKDKISIKTHIALCKARHDNCHDFSFFHNLRSKEKQYELPELLAIPYIYDIPYVDCGAFDGDTAVRYIKNRPENKKNKIYLLEPDKENIKKAKVAMSNEENVMFCQYGAWDSRSTLSFRDGNGSASKIDNSGNISIETIPLDELVKEEKAFIKMDIEGAELKALQGARRLIKNGSPLAICVYHNPSHLYEIPELILSINKNYDLYLRHYSDGWNETVLYAIPK